jgi:hypothetical protein
MSSVFARPLVTQFGTVGRNNYFGPSFFADDLSLQKNIPIREGITGQFRVDAFNGFNHITPGNPASTCIDCAAATGAGTITGMALGVSPRQLQFALTVSF